MLNNLCKMYEISEYINDENALNNINLMKNAIDKKNFILSFVGQFSAGKSKLINNIIGKEILPVHIKETTQVVTFMKYSEEEYGTIVYKDKSSKIVALDRIKDIWQWQEETEDLDISNIHYIEIFVKSNFLSQGLILADTPGVNTTIEEHEKITNDVLKASEEIMYVMSKTLTDVDKNFIKQISGSGLKISCVRTFMDKIKAAEEDPKESIEKDKKTLSELGCDDKINCYHISNEMNSIWFENIDKIKSYIINELSSNVTVNLKRSIASRLKRVSEDVLEDLEEKKNSLEKILSGSIEEVQDKKNEADKVIQMIEERVEKENRNIQKEIAEVKSEAQKEIADTEKNIIRNIKNEIEEIAYSKDSAELLKKTVFKNLNNSYSRLVESYMYPFDTLITEKGNEIKAELTNMNIESLIDFNQLIPSGIEEVACTIDEEDHEIEHIKRNMILLADNIEEREKKLQECNLKKEEYEAERNNIYNIVKEIEMEIAEHGNYQCRLIVSEDQPMQPSQILKTIGNGLDWATLFIPGKAYNTIASKVGKGCAIAGKAIAAYKNVDSIKDAAFALNKIVKTTRETTKRTKQVMDVMTTVKDVSKGTRLLDMLTFQHWFEKIGSNFDKPLKMEVDKEYERQFNEKRAILTQKYSEAKTKEIEKLQKLGLIKSEEQKIKKMNEIEERKNKELLDELKQKESQMRQEAVNREFARIKTEYIEWFEVRLKSLKNLVVQKSDKLLDKVLCGYVERCTVDLVYKLNKLKESNNALLEQFNNSGIDELKEEFNICKNYIDYIKEIDYEQV
ncbi:dynamin family protein [Clostridium butyricum]|uniref:dynamin family protein n=1 Tax=Clostridium butyricum TaxID=1492 RepID=UPI00374F4CF1